mmetsp:Transcript_30535/g.79204  ORF Transcript_30535/g.79204 Transcript_30535/m.79204 type:complete len:145 (-) Transcript_30535:1695-2129(-)
MTCSRLSRRKQKKRKESRKMQRVCDLSKPNVKSIVCLLASQNVLGLSGTNSSRAPHARCLKTSTPIAEERMDKRFETHAMHQREHLSLPDASIFFLCFCFHVLPRRTTQNLVLLIISRARTDSQKEQGRLEKSLPCDTVSFRRL